MRQHSGIQKITSRGGVLMFFYQPPKGSNCFSRGGGVHTSISKETFSHLCFLRGGGGGGARTSCPLWIRPWVNVNNSRTYDISKVCILWILFTLYDLNFQKIHWCHFMIWLHNVNESLWTATLNIYCSHEDIEFLSDQPQNSLDYS